MARVDEVGETLLRAAGEVLAKHGPAALTVRRIAAEGKREPLQLRMHPETALHVLTEEHDLMRKLERMVGFNLEMRDDPLLKPDEFKLVVKGAERDVTDRYAVA